MILSEDDAVIAVTFACSFLLHTYMYIETGRNLVVKTELTKISNKQMK